MPNISMAAAAVKEVWGKSADLYSILGVAKTASASEIKKAYFKKALLWHPDKAGDDPSATKKFQGLSFIHSVLSDKNRRKSYDATGRIDDVDDDFDSESADAWNGYWRAMFPVVTEEQIEQVLTEYRDSADEKSDVLKWYEECGGDMDDMLDCIIGAREDDVPRYVRIVQNALSSGELTESYAAFTDVYGTAGKGPGKKGLLAAKKSSLRRVNAAAGEAAEAEAMLDEMRAEHKKKLGGAAGAGAGGSAAPSLEEMILGRRSDREFSFASSMAALEAKYGGQTTKQGKHRSAMEDGGASKKRKG